MQTNRQADRDNYHRC